MNTETSQTVTSSDQALSAEDVADVRAAWANEDEK